MVDARLMRWRRFGGGLGISLLIHAVVAGALLFSFAWPEPDEPEQPAEEPVVEVTLVPPPEPPAPEEAAQEEPLPEETPPEATEAEAPPPPPPPPAPEQAPPETRPETADAPEVKAPPILPMRPVVQFGDKDAGLRKEDGSAVDEPAETPVEEPVEEPPVTEPEKPLEAPKDEAAAAKPLPDIALPEADLEGMVPDPSADGEALSGESIAALNEADVEEPETPEQADADAAPPKLDEAKKLFSTAITSDPAAMTAMNGLPRERRADQLCTTELREQLRNATPPYRPELLPSFGLKKGNVLAPAKTAFRASGQWYDLSFRCEVDDEATKVVSFGFTVGQSIPRSEWRKRRFPDF